MSATEAKRREVSACHDKVTAMKETRDDFAGVQRGWAATPLRRRIAVLKRARHGFVERVADLCDAISPELSRNAADTRVAEILPLLEACRFLEREAARILAPRRLGVSGRPFWLGGVSSEVHRVPMGRVLIIAPSNYPLFLPGVQVLQALAAGNLVLWKPGRGGHAVAALFASVLQQAGLPEGLLTVTQESVAAAQAAIALGVDKVFFTGSAGSGKEVMRQLAETLTPCVAELSGCDAAFVLPSADLSRVVKALAFGMRLNGSATCLAPRRIVLVGTSEQRRTKFIDALLSALDWIKGVRLSAGVGEELSLVVDDALLSGGRVHGKVEPGQQQPIVITGVRPDMMAARVDIFAPLLAVMEASDIEEAIALHEACPYALTASIFGDEDEARLLAEKLTLGTVTINDLILPTADPRAPFGGRRGSGFGTTRGAEGLLEMTAAKTIAVKRGGGTRQFDATTPQHEPLFDGVIKASHAGSLSQRMSGVREMLAAAGKLGRKN